MLPGLSLIGGTRLYHANVAPHLRQRKKRFLFEKCFCLKHVNNRCKGYVASSRLMQIVSKKGGKVFLRALADASRVQKKVERFFLRALPNRSRVEKRWKGLFASALAVGRMSKRWKGFFASTLADVNN